MSSCCLSVCLSVCLLYMSAEYLKNYERIFIKFSGRVGRGATTNRLDFGSQPDSLLDPGSFSTIF